MTVAYDPHPPAGTRGMMPVSVPAHATLQVAQVWSGRILDYRLLHRSAKLSLGSSVRASFHVPVPGPAKARFVFVRYGKRNGQGQPQCTLRLLPGMDGEVVKGGQSQKVTDLLAEPDLKPRRKPTDVREVILSAGDRAKITLDEVPGLRFEVRWVEAPVHVPRPGIGQTEPILLRIAACSTVVLGVLATVAMLAAGNMAPPGLAINAERAAKILPSATPPPPEANKPRDKEKDKEKEKAEQGQMKKAKGDQGRLGRHDADQKDTVIPKGEKDILRDKVSKVGLLGLIGKERPAGSGLAKLFADNSNDVEQAVAGMKGAHLVAGRGSGGLSTTGSGLGGGGTGNGHLYGAGELDTGGRGRAGRGHGPVLSGRKEREVSVDTKGGNVDEGGGLSKEQVAKVVRAHQSAIKFCYEKELQRKPSLSGTIEINWTITPDGAVERSKIAKSNMGDDAVEGCATRQVKQWVFPKSSGKTVVTYPFTFRGGV